MYNAIVRPPLRFHLKNRADILGSKVRYSVPAAAPDRSAGAPRCVECQKEFPKAMADDFDQKFCSDGCRKEHSIRCFDGAARKALFDIERGVCKICKVDAHGLFLRVKALRDPQARMGVLMGTRFNTLQKQTEGMLQRPSEGMFWQGDHITAVAEVGGTQAHCQLVRVYVLATTCSAMVVRWH